MQRRVEEPDRHRQAGHGPEDPLEVGLLEGEQPVESAAASAFVVSEDHLLHDRQALLAEEHVLGAAEADALRAELTCPRRVLGRVGVRADLQPAQLVRPAEDGLEVLVHLRRDERDLADVDVARAAVDRDHVAFVQLLAAETRDPAAEL